MHVGGTSFPILYWDSVLETLVLRFMLDVTKSLFLGGFGWNIRKFVWCVVFFPVFVSWHWSLLSRLESVRAPFSKPDNTPPMSSRDDANSSFWILTSLGDMVGPAFRKIFPTSLLVVKRLTSNARVICLEFFKPVIRAVQSDAIDQIFVAIFFWRHLYQAALIKRDTFCPLALSRHIYRII